MNENRHPKCLGNIYNSEWGTGLPGNVWDIDGDNISPTLTTMQGGGRQPMILETIPCAVDKNGEDGNFAKTEDAKLCDIGQKVCHALTTKEPAFSNHHSKIAVVRIKQANDKGYEECKLGGVANLSYMDSKTRRGRVQEGGDICPTLTAQNSEICKIETRYRIRKLTPKECWRLMGFDDKDFERASKVNSDSQLYKQAGNSIVVNVLEEIFKQMLWGK